MLAAIVLVCRRSLEIGKRAGATAPALRSCRIIQLLRKPDEETLQESELHVGVRKQREETGGVVCQRSGMNGLEICSTCSDGGLDLHFECIKCCLGCLGRLDLSQCLQLLLKRTDGRLHCSQRSTFRLGQHDSVRDCSVRCIHTVSYTHLTLPTI